MRALVIALILFLSYLALPGSALAQDRPSTEIAGGYSFLRDYHVKANFPAAWFASGARRISDSLAVVGELGGSYKKYEFTVNPTTEDLTVGTTNWSTTTRLHTLLGGVRHTRGKVFVQVLAGPAWESGGVNVFRQSVASHDPKLALQPGGGIDVPLTDRLSVRLGADYRRIFADRKNEEEKNNDEFRLIAGLVAGF